MRNQTWRTTLKETSKEQLKNMIEQKMQDVAKHFETLPENEQQKIYIEVFDSITQTLIKGSSRTGENGLQILFFYLEAILQNLPLTHEGRKTTVVQCQNIINIVAPKDSNSFKLH